MSGLEVCRQIKNDPTLRSIVVVLLTERDIPDELQAAGFELGIDGLVVNGIPDKQFLACIQSMVQQRRTTLELEERLQFETLLTDISARFVNLPSNRIDGRLTPNAIFANALGWICLRFGNLRSRLPISSS